MEENVEEKEWKRETMGGGERRFEGRSSRIMGVREDI